MILTCAKQTWKSKHAANKAGNLKRDEVKKIAVIKHAALGDMVHIRPMLITLRREFPNAKITLDVISHYMRGIPEDLIDKLHITKGKDFGFAETYKSITSLGEQDIIFDISATTRSFWMTLLTPAKLKIGYMHKGIHRLVYDVAIPRAHYRFEAETFAEQLNTIGIEFEWPLVYNMPKLGTDIEQPYIVYFPTASTLDKSWPADNYVTLLNQTTQKFSNYKHILLSGIDGWEKDIAQQIKNNVNSDIELIYGGKETDSLICNAALLVSADTGIRNLAIAYDTPTLSIFSPFIATVYGYRPLYGNHTIIHSQDDESITVDNVLNGFNKALK